MLNQISNCYPVPRGTRNHSREALWNSGVTSVDSGLQLHLGIALNGVSAKVKPLNRSLSPAESTLGRRFDVIKPTLTVLPRRAYWTLVLCLSGASKLFVTMETYEVRPRNVFPGVRQRYKALNLLCVELSYFVC